MIKIVAKNNYLSVCGHAEADEKGKDIVCAAVSALITGAAEIWCDRDGVEIIKDDSSVTFQFNLDIMGVDIKYEYQFLMKYLKLLSSIYPKYIKIIFN